MEREMIGKGEPAMTRKDETNAKRQAAYRARRTEAAKKWEQLNVGEQSAVLVLPTDDQQKAVELFDQWIAATYSLTGSKS
jgi:hypothetical protein